LTSERGFTLIELLLASVLMLIVLGATLNSLDVFTAASIADTKTNDQQDRIRFSIDRLTKQLRNLANPTNGTLNTIAYAGPNKIVFQTTDPNRQWVLYCLDSGGRLWYEASSGGANAAPGGSPPDVCPDTNANWVTQRRIGGGEGGPSGTDHITNGSLRPVFRYADRNGNEIPFTASGPVASSNLTNIELVRVDLFLDIDPAKQPGELELASGIHLRNQFSPPTAQFTAVQTGGTTTWQFDASASTNPQATTSSPFLQYAWYMADGTPTDIPSGAALSNLDPCVNFPSATFTFGGVNWTCMGSGLQLVYNFASFPPGGSRNVFLRTTNAGKLSAFSTLPAGGCPVAAPAGTRADDTQCLNIPF
jgi:prepilin-type N-terminal cleavage/methylation domain-containing protein